MAWIWLISSKNNLRLAISFFLTGYDDFEFARKAIKLGADDYLLKPFSKDDIEEMLAKVKGKLDQERKKAQVEDLVSQGYSTDLEEAIHARLADSQLTLKDLAYQLGFSASYLSVLIKEKIGTPFQDYLIQERMKKAQLLLLTTDLKIYEIADQVGFEDMNYFSQRFKQVVGVTPRQYKKGEHEWNDIPCWFSWSSTFFSSFSYFFGLIGGLYYQTSSGTIRQQTERTTRNSIDQSSQFITSYLKKIKADDDGALARNRAVRQFAQDRSADQETVQHLMRTMIETDPDLVSAVLVTKDGRLVATDSKISMQTSSDMMNESWYQEAIKEEPCQFWRQLERNLLTSEKKKKWVVSITQEVVDQTGQNLGVVRLDIGYDSLQAYFGSPSTRETRL